MVMFLLYLLGIPCQVTETHIFYESMKEITNRRSVRSYKSDAVPEELIEEIIKAAQFAPTAHNNLAVEFVVVTNKNTKNQIFDIVGQDFVNKAPVLLFLVTDVTKTTMPIQDLSVASENIFLQAASLGIGTVWKNLQPDWAERIKKLLNIPENYTAINLIPVGYPKEKIKPHTNADFDKKKIHKETW